MNSRKLTLVLFKIVDGHLNKLSLDNLVNLESKKEMHNYLNDIIRSVQGKFNYSNNENW